VSLWAHGLAGRLASGQASKLAVWQAHEPTGRPTSSQQANMLTNQQTWQASRLAGMQTSSAAAQQVNNQQLLSP